MKTNGMKGGGQLHSTATVTHSCSDSDLKATMLANDHAGKGGTHK